MKGNKSFDLLAFLLSPLTIGAQEVPSPRSRFTSRFAVLLLRSFGCYRVPLCFCLAHFTMIVDTICQSRSFADGAFVLPFEKCGWHEIGFVGRELGLVTRRAVSGTDNGEAATVAARELCGDSV